MAESTNWMVIDTATGIVVDAIVWDGETPWTAPEGSTVVQSDVAGIGWSYANGTFTAPPVPPPSAADILTLNTSTQAALLTAASQAMTPLLLSLQLGNATADETAQAKAWQTYYRAVQAIDLTVQSPTWPTQPA